LSFLAEVRSGLGEPEMTLDLAMQAVRADPSASYHRLALARILWNQRRLNDAVRMAESALQAADDENERQQARQFLDFASRRP
jgi:hypothetical protein